MARKYGTRALKKFLVVARVYIGACRKLRWQMDYHCDRLSAWRDFGFNCKLAALECRTGTASAFRHYISGLKREFGFSA
ncbi:MAG: hypothetical protein V1701_02290 [Planctomycetota bacterium]